MACVFGWISGIAIVLFVIQICRIVIPWLYVNIIGPNIIGARIKLKEMGEWACKCFFFTKQTLEVGRLRCLSVKNRYKKSYTFACNV